MLKILPFIFFIPGFLTVFAARTLVEKYNLDQKTKCDFDHEMSEEELCQYKFNKAVVNIKMLGMLIAIPGIILLLIIYK